MYEAAPQLFGVVLLAQPCSERFFKCFCCAQHCIAQVYEAAPQLSGVVLLALASAGRGGMGDMGQRIRDEILAIQQRNGCKVGADMAPASKLYLLSLCGVHSGRGSTTCRVVPFKIPLALCFTAVMAAVLLLCRAA